MDYLTLPDVELATVGMEWPAVSGPTTISFEDLAAMEAAQHDPHLTAGRVKIGHYDPRWGVDLGMFDPTWDGSPVFGSVKNLRLVNDGAVLIGDLVEVPEWLAEAAPSAWPTRSIEAPADVKSYSGKTYARVLTGVALGGEWTPAVQDLDDLIRLVSQGPDSETDESGDPASMSAPEISVLVNGEQITVNESVKAHIAMAAGADVVAAADVDKVIDTFFNEWATDEEGRYWHWPRAVWTDPNELIVDDDKGHLYRLPFSSSADGAVTFGEPQEVRQEFVDVTSGDFVAAAKRTGSPKAVFTSKADDRLPTRTQEPSTMSDSTTTEPAATEPEVDLPALRASLDLPEDATLAQINEKLAANAAAAATDPPPDPTAPAAGTETTPTSPAVEPETPAPGAEAPVAATADPTATVEVSAAQWAQAQRDIAEGVAARTEQTNERRMGLVAAAVSDGRIAPSEKDAWLAKISDDNAEVAAAAEDKLASLAKGLIPVTEVGTTAPDGDLMSAVHNHFGIGK